MPKYVSVVLILLILTFGWAISLPAQSTPTLTTGALPTSVAFAPTLGWVVVTSQANSDIEIYDALPFVDSHATPRATHKISQISVGGVAVDDALGLAVVANPASGSVTVVDLTTFTVATVNVESIPTSVDINTATHVAVVANSASQSLSLLDLRSGIVIDTIANVPTNNNTSVQAVAVDSGTNTAYVINSAASSISSVNLATGVSATNAIAVGTNPVAIAVNPVTHVAVVCNSAGNSISIVDLRTSTQTEVSDVPLSAPQGIAIYLPTNTAVISSTASNEVVLYNLNSRQTISRLTSLNQPGAAAASTIQRLAAAVLPPNNSVAMITIPTVDTFSVVNSADYYGYVAPGALAAGFGTSLSNTTEQAAAGVFPLPTVLANRSVKVAGILAPLLYVSPTQVNFQVPFEVVAGVQNVTLINASNNGTLATGKVSVLASAPAMFTFPGTGIGDVAALNTDNVTYPSADGCLGTAAKPVKAGDTIQIFGTGQGVLSPKVATGQQPSQTTLSKTPTTPAVTIGGFPATVNFSGAAPCCAGLWQINAVIPTGAPSGPRVPVVATLNNVSSPTTGTIAIDTTVIECKP